MNEMEVDFCERLGDVEARASMEVPLSGCSAHIVVRDMSYLEEDPEDESGGDALSLKNALTAYLEGNAGYEDRDLRAEVEGSFAALKKSLAFLGVTGRLIPMPPLSATSTEDELFEAAVRDFEDALTEQDLLITEEDVRAIRREVAEEEGQFRAGAKMLAKVMKEEGLRRGLDKEGRDGLTIGDLLRPEGE